MLQNKIYQNFIVEIFKTFLTILFGLTLIAITVRAVSFLELIVDSGYSVTTYFKYSLYNIFGIIPKFIPLSFLSAMSIFILKHIQDGELTILWTSGVKKIQLVNLFVLVSIIIALLYLFFSTFFSPLALNNSRSLLSQNTFTSISPTIKPQKFSDSFSGFTFFVEKKTNNNLKNIFLNDKKKLLRNLSPNSSSTDETTIFAKNGVVKDKKLFLFNGKIISVQKNTKKNDIIRFSQLDIDLSNLNTNTIKKPKLQELSTMRLINCFTKNSVNDKICNDEFKKEIIPNIIRRVVLPLYVPVLALISSLLLIKFKYNNFKKISIFSFGFIILLFTEISIRYTGIFNSVIFVFTILPIILIIILYFFLAFQFNKEIKT